MMSGGAPDFQSPIPPGYTLYFQICADYGSSYTYSGWSAACTTVNYPGAPQNLEATVSGENIALSWDAPASNGGGAISEYRVYRGSASGSLDQITSVASGLSYVDDTAAGGQTYYYAVAAYNGYTGARSVEASVTLPPGRPGVVQGLQCASGLDSISLSWNAPSSDGGEAITGYQIYRSTVSGEEGLFGATGPTTLAFVDADVVAGQQYFYQVTAMNSIGESARGSEGAITYVAPPSAPQGLQATGGPGRISLTWQAPAGNGGSPIIWYDIYRNNVTAGSGWEYYDYTDNITSYNDAYVQLGCTYQYKISAWNEDYAEGPFSDVLEVAYVLPSEPLGIEAEIDGKGSLLVSWDAPASAGVTGYKLYWGTSPGAYTDDLLLPIVNSYLLEGLNDDTTYYLTVAAVSSMGTGAAGTPAIASTAAVPGAVVNIGTWNNGPGKINIFWYPPADDGGLPVNGYTIYRGTDPDAVTFLANVPAEQEIYHDQGLLDGVPYYYRVTAGNLVGEGAPASVSEKCGSPPTSPTGLTATGGLGAIALNWEPSEYTGGGLYGYIICRSSASDGTYTLLVEVGPDVTSYNDLVGQNQTWYYKVYAAGKMGTSWYSNMASATSYAPPTVPSSFNAEIGDGAITLSWSPPSFQGEPTLLGYAVYRGSSPMNMQVLYVVGVVQSYTDTGLVNGDIYYYAVQAYNAEFFGPLSDTLGVSPGRAPQAPGTPVATAGDSYVDLTWDAPFNDGGRTVQRYEVYRGESGVFVTVGITMLPSFTDATAVNGHSYSYHIVAINALGASDPSAEASSTPARTPSAPADLDVDGGFEAIHLNWTAPADMGGGVLNYLIYRSEGSGEAVLIATIGNTTYYADLDVVVGTTYGYRVAASNWAGEGPQSGEAANTTIFRPGAAQNVEATAGVGHVVLTWERPDTDGNSLIGYRVYRSASSGLEVLVAELGDVLSFEDAAVINGTMYTYSVVSFNPGYASVPSGSVSAMPYTVPSAPSSVIVTGGTRNITVSWAAPTSDGGASILGYRVHLTDLAGTITMTFDVGLSYLLVIDPLSDGTIYVATVTAYNIAGDGAAGEGQDATNAPPPAPVAAVHADGTWTLVSWTVPGSDAPITGYVLYRAAGSGTMAPYQFLGPVLFFHDTAVTKGQTYRYAVAAVSEVGEGAMSGVVQGTPYTMPDAPAGLTAAGGYGKADLSWNPPADDGGSAITGYNVYSGPSAEALAWIALVAGNSYADTGLAPGASCVYGIAAVTSIGEGEMITVTVTALLPPPAPADLSAVRSDDGAVVTWTMPATDETTAPVTGFAVYRGTSDGDLVLIAVVNDTSARSFTDTGAPGSELIYAVAALHGDVLGGVSSMSAAAGLSGEDSPAVLLIVVALVAVAGMLSALPILGRRKRGGRED
ncbi:MAG: fibronectin type III domain-containing protein [Methanomassiliicoccus sp.]|nr:fibronectin type III domain-containing protein [Methanomassiliicoccus sp.]